MNELIGMLEAILAQGIIVEPVDVPRAFGSERGYRIRLDLSAERVERPNPTIPDNSDRPVGQNVKGW